MSPTLTVWCAEDLHIYTATKTTWMKDFKYLNNLSLKNNSKKNNMAAP